MSESNGPNIHLPDAGALDSFLEGSDGTDQQDALDTAVAADEAVTEDSPEGPEPQGDSFPRPYVEKLRRENASYRERAKKFEAMFEGYEEGAVDEWRYMIENFRNDSKGVAEHMKTLAEEVLGQFTPQEQEQIAEAVAEGEDVPLTRAQFDQLMGEREKQWEMDNMVQDIEREATELGYNLKSREYKILLMTAQELPSGSIEEAHALLEGEKQRIVDAELARLEKEGGRKLPGDKHIVPDQAKGIKDFKDAKAALSNYLDANFK